jgi:hypothetical protein
MTMIVAAHLGDCVLIAADKRAMACDLETGAITHHTDHQQKIKRWNRGAVAGTGENVLLERIAQYFANYRDGDGLLRQMDTIQDELAKRISEGVPRAALLHNTIIFSMFNGVETLLHSIPTEPFFDVFEEDGIDMIRPRMDNIEKRTIGVTCFNIPPDMTSLQQFQQNIKPLAEFIEDTDFVLYYIKHLKHVFATHAAIDPSITTSFDLYIQSCETGESIAVHVQNHILPSAIPENLNFWDRKR